MFDFNDEEVKKYRNDCIFRSAMETSFRNGLTKEEALTFLCMALLNLKDEAFQEKIDKAMHRKSPFFINTGI